MTIRQSIATLCLCAAHASRAQAPAHEYRPQVVVTLPRWHGGALALMIEQHLATDGLGPVERHQGIFLLGPGLEFGNASLELRQVVSGAGVVEHRYIPTVNLTTALGPRFELRDRVRIEVRDIAGSWSRRYQNRLTLTRIVSASGRKLLPYGYFDLSYDSRYDALTRREVGLGIRIPLAGGASLDPFVMRQTDRHRPVPTVVATGLAMRVVL
jgi:hypothetical protein